MSSTSAKSGDIVKAYCSHCRQDHDSETISSVGKEIVSIKCRTCGTTQSYGKPQGSRPRGGRRVVNVETGPRRQPRSRGTGRRVVSTTGREIRDAPRRPRSGPAKVKPLPVNPHRQQWNTLTDAVDSRYARPHRPSDRYEADEVILHTEFGMGIVESVGEEGELNVMFKHGYEKLLSRQTLG